jgi:predicted HAD superfamily phosphohydrolase YqeG
VTAGGYEPLPDRVSLLRRAAGLAAKTIIIDVEPLIAWWDTSQKSLDQGIAAVLDQIRAMPEVLVICFATNSGRRPSAVPAAAGIRVLYVSSARKPFRTAPYRALPRPGVVIGDQVTTDGILASRLGYTFLHYNPPLPGIPLGPRLMRYSGRLVLPVLHRAARIGGTSGSDTGAGRP